MTWANFYLFCFLVGFLWSMATLLVGHLNIHMPFHHGDMGHGMLHDAGGMDHGDLSHGGEKAMMQEQQIMLIMRAVSASLP